MAVTTTMSNASAGVMARGGEGGRGGFPVGRARDGGARGAAARASQAAVGRGGGGGRGCGGGGGAWAELRKCRAPAPRPPPAPPGMYSQVLRAPAPAPRVSRLVGSALCPGVYRGAGRP